jgi:hypothetical protein
MRRLFWMGVGAAAAAIAAQRLRTAWHRYTPEGLAEQVEQAGQGVIEASQAAVVRFRSAYATRERDLVDQLLVRPEGGDPSAVFRGREAAPRWADADRATPAGRVDDDEPLYDF